MIPSEVPQTAIADLPTAATLLDVREDDEWAAGHAPGAVHVRMGEVPQRLSELLATPVYVICRSGARSDRVAQFLIAHGIGAANVAGGMQAWESSGRPMACDGDGPARVI